MRRTLATVALGLAMLLSSWAPAQAEPTPINQSGIVRLSGSDRYATAVSVSRRSFGPPVGAAFVATGTAFADALAAGPTAARLSAPLLMVAPTRVPPQVWTELKRLRPRTIYVLGGSAAVSAAVARQLRSVAPVVRLAGRDRYATAAKATSQVWKTASTVYLASGAAFPDALSGGAAATEQNAPMLLTTSRALGASTRTELRRLQPTRVTLVGGSHAISHEVAAAVRRLLPRAVVERYAGADRYATSAALAKGVWPNSSDTVYYATGLTFPDALSGTPSAAVNGAPLLLTRTQCAPRPVFDESSELRPRTRVLLGGDRALATWAVDTPCDEAYRIVPGVDVSSHQGNVDWSALWQQGNRFAYVKASEGITYSNAYFAQQYNGSYDVGMLRGSYHFALPNVSSGARQANFFVAHGGAWSADGRTLPGALDIEYNPYGSTCFGLSRSEMVDWIAGFLDQYKLLTGRDAVIYTTTDWWTRCTGNTGRFSATSPLWIARYASTPGTLPGKWSYHTFWQYRGRPPVDNNLFNGSLPRLRALALG